LSSQQPSLHVAWSHGALESKDLPPELLLPEPLLLELPLLELVPPPEPPPSSPPSKLPRAPRPPPDAPPEEPPAEPPEDEALGALAQPPPWHVWPLAPQSVHSSAPLPHALSSVPAWQLPVESQQPPHDAQEPASELLLPPESSLAVAPPFDEPVLEPPCEDAYELLLAGRPEPSADAPESPPPRGATTPSNGGPEMDSPAAHPTITKSRPRMA
jgi:hypothetical protein